MLILLAAVILGTVVTIGLVIAVVWRAAERQSVEVLTFANSVDALSCTLDAGNVDAIASTAAGAVVRRTIRHGARAPTTSERLDGTRLVLDSRGRHGWFRGWWWVDYDVRLPAGASVVATTATGRLSVAGVWGDLELRSQAGKLRVREARGRLRLRSSAGSIEGEELHSSDVEARTEAGHVVLAFATPPERVDVTASAGAIELRLPGGPYAVDASSAAGRVHVEVPTDPASARRVVARSMAGSVHVVGTQAAGRETADRATDGAVAVTMERIDDPAGAALVAALLRELYDRYGEEDPDAPDPHDLAPPDGAFLVARVDGRPVGCGALKRLDDGLGELKRMYVVPDARRSGVAAELLRVLEARAWALGYRRLRLETGVRQPEAIALYERFGYARIANYPPYEHAPMSVCFEKVLTPGDGEA
ncbi:MAG TPA: GNAT family N-acetyltransferase [Acidimicrobiia bacterium]|jgi:GNAT superfamily N-acetyltransferase